MTEYRDCWNAGRMSFDEIRAAEGKSMRRQDVRYLLLVFVVCLIAGVIAGSTITLLCR